MTIKTRLILVTMFAAAVAMTTAGCFEAQLEMAVSPDGSGTITRTVLFSEQMMGMLKMTAGMSEEEGAAPVDPIMAMIDKDKLEKEAGTMGEGVTLKSAEKITKDQREGIKTVFAFTDANKVKLPLQPAPNMDAGPEEEGAEKPEQARFAFTPATAAAPAKLTITMPQPKADPNAPAPEAPEELTPEQQQQMAMMKQMLADMRMGITVKVNGTLVESNATHVDKETGTVTLMDMQMGKMVNDDAAFTKMMKMQGQDMSTPDEMKKFLDDPDMKKYFKMETQEKVNVEFK